MVLELEIWDSVSMLALWQGPSSPLTDKRWQDASLETFQEGANSLHEA